jgi:hypothetical protein
MNTKLWTIESGKCWSDSIKRVEEMAKGHRRISIVAGVWAVLSLFCAAYFVEPGTDDRLFLVVTIVASCLVPVRIHRSAWHEQQIFGAMVHHMRRALVEEPDRALWHMEQWEKLSDWSLARKTFEV